MGSVGTFLLLDIFILIKVLSLSYNLFIVVSHSLTYQTFPLCPPTYTFLDASLFII